MGERAKNMGEEAENKVARFLNDLGYEFEDVNVEGYDLDGIAKSPDVEPDVGLANPSYSPSGLVALETRQTVVTKKRIDEFAQKIKKYNKENDQKLSGGIYLVARWITPKMLKYMRKKRIWGWGHRRTRLYREKKNAFFYLVKEGAFIVEKRIDNKNSYLQIATPPPTESGYLMYFSVICDDLDEKLSFQVVRRLMNKIRELSITPLLELGIKPISVYFQFFSIGGFTEKLFFEENKKIINDWKEKGINVDISKFSDFRTFPTL